MNAQGVWVMSWNCCKAVKYTCSLHQQTLWSVPLQTSACILCRFEDLLRSLTVERKDICDAMIFALDNADSAFEVCSRPLQAFHAYDLFAAVSGHQLLSVLLEALPAYTGIHMMSYLHTFSI